MFNEIIETVLWYRPKLAHTLTNLNLSYNKIYEKLLDQYYKWEIEKDLEVQFKMKTAFEDLEKLTLDKIELDK